MELIFAFFALPYVFWALVLAFSLGIALNIDDNKGGGWGWTTVFTAGLVYLVGNHYGFDFMSLIHNPSQIAIGAGIYAVIGVLWSFAKWYFKLSGVRDTYLELKEKYVKQHKPVNFLQAQPELSDEELQALTKDEAIARDTHAEVHLNFFSWVRNSMHIYDGSVSKSDVLADPANIVKSIKPLAMNHKSSITQWIAFWPVSFAWTIINDPVRKVANYIFSRIKGTFQKMSDSMFAGV